MDRRPHAADHVPVARQDGARGRQARLPRRPPGPDDVQRRLQPRRRDLRQRGGDLQHRRRARQVRRLRAGQVHEREGVVSRGQAALLRAAREMAREGGARARPRCLRARSLIGCAAQAAVGLRRLPPPRSGMPDATDRHAEIDRLDKAIDEELAKRGLPAAEPPMCSGQSCAGAAAQPMSVGRGPRQDPDVQAGTDRRVQGQRARSRTRSARTRAGSARSPSSSAGPTRTRTRSARRARRAARPRAAAAAPASCSKRAGAIEPESRRARVRPVAVLPGSRRTAKGAMTRHGAPRALVAKRPEVPRRSSASLGVMAVGPGRTVDRCRRDRPQAPARRPP